MLEAHVLLPNLCCVAVELGLMYGDVQLVYGYCFCLDKTAVAIDEGDSVLNMGYECPGTRLVHELMVRGVR
jgi:hypothetical protein